jgi:hypothetical protein
MNAALSRSYRAIKCEVLVHVASDSRRLTLHHCAALPDAPVARRANLSQRMDSDFQNQA